jgi:hypothetical protein
MTEKYGITLPDGTRIGAEDPKLAHKLVNVLRLPLDACARLTATAINVLALPFAFAEAYGKRLLATIEAAEAQVPPERRIPPAPSVAGPILENVKYLEEGNPLLQMFVNLLARSMDRDRENEAHPAFPALISQLSADEALLLYQLAACGVLYRIELYDYYGASDRPGTDPEIKNRRTTDESTWCVPGLSHPQHEGMYLSRLLGALNLITFQPATSMSGLDTDTDGRQFHTYEIRAEIRLSDFGKLFATACVPTQWPARATS